MIPYTFEGYSDLYKRTFIKEQKTFWTPTSRPIYERLPGENETYYKGPNQKGFFLGATSENSAISSDKKASYLQIAEATTTWEEGELIINPFIVGIDFGTITWGSSELFFKGECLENNGNLYTAQYDFTSSVSIERDLELGNLIKVGIPSTEGTYYLSLDLLTDYNILTVKEDIPERGALLDYITVTASRYYKCNKAYHVFDNDPVTNWTVSATGQNNDDWLKIEFNGEVELTSFKLISKFPLGPNAKLYYGPSSNSSPIGISDFISPVNGVYTFPISPSYIAKYLYIEFSGTSTLAITDYRLTGRINIIDDSTLKGLFVAPAINSDYVFDEIRTCPIAKITLANGKIIKVEDLRVFSTESIGSIADWLTVYWDDLLITNKQNVENFVKNYLSPQTAGLQFYSIG